MRFKPVTAKYNFGDVGLTRDYPSYLAIPLTKWIADALTNATFLRPNYNESFIDIDFGNALNLHLRESFPREWEDFIRFTFGDSERTTNVLGFILQNATPFYIAEQLEDVLSVGGSAYAVMAIDASDTSPFSMNNADLVERVPRVVLEASREALDDETLIREAWHACYSKNPDYEKVVSRCCDVLERVFQKKFFPKDPKPQIKKYVHDFKATPGPLSYKGDSIVSPKNLITDLAEQFSDVRGHL